jgi:hypothetical protein
MIPYFVDGKLTSVSVLSQMNPVHTNTLFMVFKVVSLDASILQSGVGLLCHRTFFEEYVPSAVCHVV